MEKVISKPFIMLIMLILTVFSPVGAKASTGWTVNPADYRYDMSLYLEVALDDAGTPIDYGQYEVAAFFSNECRGLAEVVQLPEGGSCLYMRVRSNSESGEKIAFKMKNKDSGEITELTPSLDFKKDDKVGLPSSPYKLKVVAFYDVNITASQGGSVEDVVNGRYEEGSVLTAKAIPDEGYSFEKWSDGETEPTREITVTGDVSLTAEFKANLYKLTYMLDGVVYKEVEIPFGSEIAYEEAPVKEGYTFSGWNVSEGNELQETMPAHDVTVSGSFSVNSYTLTYVVDGKTYKEPVQVAFGAAITPEAEPEKEGYTFSGWEGLTETMPAHDVTVTGSFTVNSYKLTYVVDGDTYKGPVEVEFGATITPEAEPVKEGYTFSGWEGLPETMPAHDVTVTGSFSVSSYKLKYILDGELYKEFDIAPGSAIVPEEVPAREGYTFSGWEGLPETMPSEDVTVVGTYIVNKYKLTYTVDGETYKEYEIDFGAAIVPEAAPEKVGHTFSGWEGLPETMPASNVTAAATYTVNTYKLTYVVDGEVCKEEMYAYGLEIVPAEAPVKEGYKFVGWDGIPTTMPAEDVVVFASYASQVFKLTYVVDGEVYKEYEVGFGMEVTPEADPVKEGYTFLGWKGLPGIMPNSDVTVTGSFKINSYKLSYRVDYDIYKEVVLEYGAKIVPENGPEKEGYYFAGWEGLPETMPAKDLAVFASYTINSYKIVYMLDGEVYKESEYEYGAKVIAEAAPEKEGYTFSGWKDVPETMPAFNVTVNGHFSVNSYKLTYIVDGEVYKELTVAYGSELTPEAAPEKEGYTFSGWKGLPATMPAEDVTVTGSFTVNIYKLTVYIDGEIYYEAELETGAVISIPEPEMPADKKFDGWKEEVPATMPAHDVEIHGTTSSTSGLSGIFADDDALLTVYNLRGVLVLKDVTVAEASEKLLPGIYIINGKKVMIK